MNRPDLAGDASMDEILASIRKIIAEDPGIPGKRPFPEPSHKLPMPSAEPIASVSPPAPPGGLGARKSSMFGTLAEALNAQPPPPSSVGTAARIDDDLADILDDASGVDAPPSRTAAPVDPTPSKNSFDGLANWRSTPPGGPARGEVAPPSPPPPPAASAASGLGAFVPMRPASAAPEPLPPPPPPPTAIPAAVARELGAASKDEDPFGLLPPEPDAPDEAEEPVSTGPVVIAAMPPATPVAPPPVPPAPAAGELKSALDALMARSAALQSDLDPPAKAAPPPMPPAAQKIAAPLQAQDPANVAFAELLADEPARPLVKGLNPSEPAPAARLGREPAPPLPPAPPIPGSATPATPASGLFGGVFGKSEAEGKAEAAPKSAAAKAPEVEVPKQEPPAAPAPKEEAAAAFGKRFEPAPGAGLGSRAAAPPPAPAVKPAEAALPAFAKAPFNSPGAPPPPPTPSPVTPTPVSALDALAQGLAAAAAQPAPTLPALARSVFADPDLFIHGVAGKSAKPAAAPPHETPPPLPQSAMAELVPQPSGPRTMDETVAELLRPMLKQWLADNMPRIVEQALRIELAEGLTKTHKA